MIFGEPESIDRPPSTEYRMHDTARARSRPVVFEEGQFAGPSQEEATGNQIRTGLTKGSSMPGLTPDISCDCLPDVLP